MLSDFPVPVFERVFRWLKRPTHGLVICGKCGRGKTHLASAIIRTAILVGRDAWMRRGFEFFSEVRKAISANAEQEVLDSFVKPRYLAIDDLVWEFSPYERKIFFELLDRRGETNRPTTITTNDDLAQIARTTDERLASRLSGFDWIRLDGPDLRQFPALKINPTVELTPSMCQRHARKTREAMARFDVSVTAEQHAVELWP